MNRGIVAVCGVLAITGCVAPPEQVTRSLSLGEGSVVTDAPSGYCVDPDTSQPAKDFAILAPCAALGLTEASPMIIGVATLQVGPVDSGQIAVDELALRDFLVTDAGVRLLSATNDADNINVLSTQAFDDQVMIHFTDMGPPPLDGLQQEEWRAFANVGGRLVTVAVRGLTEAPLSEGPGATLLKQILAGIRSLSVDGGENPSQG